MSINISIDGLECEEASLNFINSRLQVILELMGTPCRRGYGELSGIALAEAYKNLQRAVDAPGTLVYFTTECVRERRFTSFGITEEYIERRSKEVLKLLSLALMEGRGISWN